MNELKFLGKPAPTLEEVGGIMLGLKRKEHFEGALKEAKELLETPVSEWSKEEQMSYSDLFTVKYGKAAFRKLNREEFVAFLISKTIEADKT